MNRIKRNRAYIFPYSSKVPTEYSNPYIKSFIDSFDNIFEIINKNNSTSIGLIDVLINIRKIDWLFLNWVENIPERKGGILQVFIFYLILVLKKITKTKVVYILHNKISHSKKKIFLKKLIFSSIIKYSDYIITHSYEGKVFAVNNYKINPDKIFFRHHPTKSVDNFFGENIKQKEKKIDILIWGNISPYKGIDVFLDSLNNNKLNEKYKILIAGKFTSNDYYKEICVKAPKGVTIENRYISDKELNELMSDSRIILFTYSSDSILSSGALIDSLYYYSHIIGPEKGSFSELSKLKLISTYNSLDSLDNNISQILDEDLDKIVRRRKEFISSCSWERFCSDFLSFISTKS